MDISIFPIPPYPPDNTAPLPASAPFEYPLASEAWYQFFFHTLTYRNALWHRWQYYPGHLYNDFVDTAQYRQNTVVNAGGLLDVTIGIPSPPQGGILDYDINTFHPVLTRKPPWSLYTFWRDLILRPYPPENNLGADDVPEGFLVLSHTNNCDDVIKNEITRTDPDTSVPLVVNTIPGVINWFFIVRSERAALLLSSIATPPGQGPSYHTGVIPILVALGVLGSLALCGASISPSRRRRKS